MAFSREMQKVGRHSAQGKGNLSKPLLHDCAVVFGSNGSTPFFIAVTLPLLETPSAVTIHSKHLNPEHVT